MQQAAKELSQKDRLAQELISINADITTSDRKDYINDRNVTRTMLTNYMHGKVGNADRALDMLLFFRDRISQREKAMKSGN